MTDLGIAPVGLQSSDVQRLKVTVGMLIVAGSVSQAWRMCHPRDADLILVASDDLKARKMLADQTEYPRATFAALVGQSDSAPPGCLTLPWPIRVDHVMTLLKSVESRQSERAPVGASASVKTDLLRLASLLHTAAGEHDPNVVWRIKGTPDRSLYVLPAARKFIYGAALLRLRTMPANVSLTFETIARDSVHDAGSRPLVALQWLVGTLTGPLGVLPWIDPATALRMRRWPDFPILTHDPRHRRIAALLGERASAVNELLGRSRMDPATVIGFVNAASLCGYVGTESGRVLGPVRDAGDRAPRALFKRLRTALGITEA